MISIIYIHWIDQSNSAIRWSSTTEKSVIQPIDNAGKSVSRAEENHAMSHDCSLATVAAFEQSQSSFLVRFAENWQARKAVRKLLNMDDFMLRDTGTSRGDVEWAAGLPLTVNAALALEERSRKNGRH
jgi:uncharacterized protein YjiS (DUF1127 family)